MTATYAEKLSLLQARAGEINQSIAAIDQQIEQLSAGYTAGADLRPFTTLEQKKQTYTRELALCLSAAGLLEQQHQQQIAELDQSIVDLDNDYGRLVEDRLVFGDQTVTPELDALIAKRGALVASRANAASAVAESQEQQAEKRKQILAAKQIADQVAEVHVDLDRKLIELRQLLERRAVLLRALANSGEGNSAWIGKLVGKQAANRAFAAAGLHAHASLETPAPGSFAGFASSNSVLLEIGSSLHGEDPPPRRARINGGDD
jgi:hypothetical protein